MRASGHWPTPAVSSGHAESRPMAKRGASVLKFTKMHGIGNDFVMVDCLTKPLPESDLPAISRRVNDRQFGIGGDGLILILPSVDADFKVRMFNPDGSEAAMCCYVN